MSEFARRNPVISLFVLLGLQVILLSVQIQNEQGRTQLRSWADTIVLPLVVSVNWVSSGVESAIDSSAALWNAHSANERLKGEVRHLRKEVIRLREMSLLSGRLEDFKVLKGRYSLRYTPATIIKRTPLFFTQEIMVDAGLRRGTRVDNAVLTADSIVVGRVVRVSAFHASVQLITSPGASAGALIGPKRVHGIVEGDGSGLLRLSYVPNSQEIAVGDAVLTAGSDRVYPKGILIGEVVRSEPGPAGQRVVIVMPSVELSRLEEVAIVGAFDDTYVD